MAKAGYCSECGENVFLSDSGGCPKGHPASCISGVYDPSAPAATPASAAPAATRRLNPILLVAAVAAGLFAVCGICSLTGLLGGSEKPTSTPPDTKAAAPTSPTTQPATAPPVTAPPATAPPADSSADRESEARAYASGVKAELDVTTSDQLMAQMPDNIQPDMSREGENRKFVWNFSDGSQMIAVFKPAGGEGSQQGLVLYMVDIKD